ncbi:hypothetical protein AAWM_08689 [Aspergillus awamori]|uniref:Uncharacterized protein n=1 Tax=Aspergillus awamori TaxID=105351 RepID=A0A401L2Q6_ASPAW|nr:hypothetical protein AAWM_08689 [Aspergillus awamori]
MNDQWSDAEIIILIYFISRGFTGLAVSHILHVRGYRRPLSAVWQTLQVILEQAPHLQTKTGRWDIDQVDWWIDLLSLEHEAVNWLISCTEIDAAIAEEHELLETILEILGCIYWRSPPITTPSDQGSIH